jgi:hypothetical protein
MRWWRAKGFVEVAAVSLALSAAPSSWAEPPDAGGAGSLLESKKERVSNEKLDDGGVAAGAGPAAARGGSRRLGAEPAQLPSTAGSRGVGPLQIVNLRNLWTHEVLPVAFDGRSGELHLPDDATRRTFFRCHFTGAPPPEHDHRLLETLVRAARHFHVAQVDIVSGYRSPKYNLLLHKKGHEVAESSRHTRGEAVDFRLPGVTTRQLLAFVRALRLGGVGGYRDSQFVHVDVGPVRYWRGH